MQATAWFLPACHEPATVLHHWRLNGTWERKHVISQGFTWQPGSFHAVDVAAAEWTWPEALRLVDAGTPLAVSGIGGVPHLAVARSGKVTVWNLATVHLIHCVRVTTAVTEIELGADIGQSWLLLGSGMDTAPKWKLESLSATAEVAVSLLPGKARLFAFSEGLRAISVAKEGTILSIQVVDPANPKVPTHNASTTIGTGEFERFTLFDAVSRGATIWMLLRHSALAISDALNLSIVTPTQGAATAVPSHRRKESRASSPMRSPKTHWATGDSSSCRPVLQNVSAERQGLSEHISTLLLLTGLPGAKPLRKQAVLANNCQNHRRVNFPASQTERAPHVHQTCTVQIQLSTMQLPASSTNPGLPPASVNGLPPETIQKYVTGSAAIAAGSHQNTFAFHAAVPAKCIRS